ncbi:hypothetical protein EC991_006460 [Linnemannia zychae]|nr:hypothetical protein EC991_006460 [Linnemannia zychae]
MTNNPLTLFCLVDGESTFNAFSVRIEPTMTISDLKDVIKTKSAPLFDDVAAKELILWHVSIPDKDDGAPVLLDTITAGEKMKLRATLELSDVFTVKPSKAMIHIIIQRLPEMLSEYDVLQFVPRPANGWAQAHSTLTEPSKSVPPRSVTPWPGFLESVRGMNLDRTQRYPKPTYRINRLFRAEEELHEIFAQDINAVGPLTPQTLTWKSTELVHGKPDLLCTKMQGSADDPQPVLFPIEIKRPIIFDCDDLVTNYNSLPSGPADRHRCKHPLSQIHGYMRLNGFRYGVLSNHNKTCPNKEPRTRSETRGKGVTQLTLPAFEKLELIVYNDEGAQTYKALWQGCNVVVKKCDIWNQRPIVEELKHEVTVYQHLEALQGSVIPKLIAAGISNGLEAVLVTDFRGRDISHEHLEDSDKEKIRKALSSIHRLGVLHGDIRPQNILVEHEGAIKRFVFIDFGRSEFTTNKKMLQQEADILSSELGW